MFRLGLCQQEMGRREVYGQQAQEGVSVSLPATTLTANLDYKRKEGPATKGHSPKV